MESLSMSETDWAYIAGIVDGEGSISIASRIGRRSLNATYSCDFTITNTCIELLEWIQAKLQSGKISPKPRDKKNWKLCHHLVFRVEEIAPILQAISKYMIVRRRHAELMLEFLQCFWTQDGDQKTKPPETIIEQKLIHDDLLAINKRGL